MAFGSDSFPLGPGGKFPRQRISSAGNEIANPNQMEGLYDGSEHARLPVLERDFHSSVNRVKNRTRIGKPLTNDKNIRQAKAFAGLFPRYGNVSASLGYPRGRSAGIFSGTDKIGLSGDNEIDEDAGMGRMGGFARKRERYLFERGYKPKF